MPCYNIQDFIYDCSQNVASIVILKNALDGACTFFDLCSNSELLTFIGNNGMENLKFINTKDWDNNPNKINNPIKIDAYEFCTIGKNGYVAFMKNEKTKKWIIKSFHDSYSISLKDTFYNPFNILGGKKHE